MSEPMHPEVALLEIKSEHYRSLGLTKQADSFLEMADAFRKTPPTRVNTNVIKPLAQPELTQPETQS